MKDATGHSTDLTDLRRRAEELLQTEEVAPEDLTPDQAAMLIHELRVHQIELEMQNDELRLSQSQLEESRSKYADLYDFAPVGYFTLDDRGRILEANLTAATLLGLERGKLLGRFFPHFLVEADRRVFRQIMHHGSKLREQRGEVHLQDGSGNVRTMLLDLLLLQDAEGQERQRLVMTDITELKRHQELAKERTADLTQVNEQLREAHDNLEALFQAAPLGISVFDDQGRIRKINPASQRIFGWSQEELEGRLPPSIPAEAPEESLAIIQRLLQGEPVIGAELKQQRRDGARIDVSFSAAPLFDADGKPRGFIGVAEDITERRRVREMVKRQAELLDLAHDAILVRDRLGRITYWNQGAAELYGWSSAEAMGEVVHRLLATEFPQPLESIETLVLEQGCWEGELIHTSRDGRRLIVASRWSLKRDETGQPLAILEINRDLTASRQVEAELRKSERRFRRLVEANIAGMAVSDEEKIIEANDAFLRMVGCTREEMLAGEVKWVEMTPREYIPQDAQALYQLRNTGTYPPYEKTFIRKDGSWVPVVVGGALLEEDPLSWISFVLDITERKQLEDSLRQSEARFRAIFSNASIGMATMDLMGRLQQFNAPVMRWLGYAPTELKSKSFLDLIYPEDLAMSKYLLEGLTSGRRDQYTLENRYVRKDGQVLSGRLHASLVRDPGGEPDFVVALVEDITAMKESQAARPGN